MDPWEEFDKTFKQADKTMRAFQTYTSTSTVGACSCGGLLDFDKSQWSIKKVFEMGRFVIFKKTRQTYKCKKCGKFS